jgi:hypothetical protein
LRISASETLAYQALGLFSHTVGLFSQALGLFFPAVGFFLGMYISLFLRKKVKKFCKKKYFVLLPRYKSAFACAAYGPAKEEGAFERLSWMNREPLQADSC